VTRLQASLHVAARALAPHRAGHTDVWASDIPLGKRGFLHTPGTCYSALRRLPRRDFHPLETCSLYRAVHGQSPAPVAVRQDAPPVQHSSWRLRDRCDGRGCHPYRGYHAHPPSGRPSVVMVKAAQHRENDDVPAWASIRGRNRSGGHSLADPLMRTPAVEMGDMLFEHAKHVALAEDESGNPGPRPNRWSPRVGMVSGARCCPTARSSCSAATKATISLRSTTFRLGGSTSQCWGKGASIPLSPHGSGQPPELRGTVGAPGLVRSGRQVRHPRGYGEHDRRHSGAANEPDTPCAAAPRDPLHGIAAPRYAG